MRGSIQVRLQKRLLILSNGCWEFQGYRDRDGYGQIGAGSPCRMIRAHRVMWEIVFGPIPDGLDVLHICDNPPCCNWRHLWLGTNADNSADMVAKNRQAKGEKQGSAKLTEEQVYAIRVDSRSHRTLAAEYEISKTQIGRIKRNERWKELVL